MPETPLPSREAFTDADVKSLYQNGYWDEEKIVGAYMGGRLVDREAIDRKRIEEILDELCRDWAVFDITGTGYDFGRAIDAIVAALGGNNEGSVASDMIDPDYVRDEIDPRGIGEA